MKNNKKETFWVALIIIAGKILALAATKLYIYVFGAENERLNIFSYALQFQSSLFQSFGGALAGVTVPTYTTRLAEGGKEEANKFANAMLCVFLAFTLLLMLAGCVLSEIIPYYTGFADAELLSKTIRYMIPLILFSCIGVIFHGVVQSFGGYRESAVINLPGGIIIIFYMLAFSQRLGINGLIGAELVSGSIQASLMICVARRKGYRWSWPWGREIAGLSSAIKRMIPIFLGALIYQLNLLLCATEVARKFPRYVATYGFMQNLVLTGTISLAAIFSTVAYPEYSKLAARENKKALLCKVRNTEKTAIIVFGSISALIFVFAMPICSILSLGGAADSDIVSVQVDLLRVFSPLVFVLGIKDLSEKYMFATGKTWGVLLGSATTLIVGIIIYSFISRIFDTVVSVPAAYLSGAVGGTLALRFVKNKAISKDEGNDGLVSRFIFGAWRNRKISGNADS